MNEKFERPSNLKPYSLGIVVETKPRGTDYILVSPIEKINIQPDGKILDEKKEFKGDKEELQGETFNVEHESRNYLRAKWLPYGESNRNSAPDVVANETVMIYKFEDVDEYFWFDIMREPELRRLEDVLYSYSNKKSGIDAFDLKSSYWIRWNTKDKYIHLHTSNNDGEPFIYDLTIDTKKGIITVKDDVGNFIKFDSSEDTATINMNKDINLIAGRDINIEAKRNVTTKGMKISEQATTIIEETAGAQVKVQGGANITLETPLLLKKVKVEQKI